MSQPNVFEQIIKLVPKHAFQASVAKFDGDAYKRRLDCWTWFGALLFGQLSGHDSIRAMERVFCQGNSRMRRLGFSTVCRSTLADANRTRPLGILEETYKAVLSRAKEICPERHGFRFKGEVKALDASVIDLCLSLSPWANFRKGRSGIKLHTAIDLAGELPDFVVITKARRHDVPIARQYFHPRPGTTVIIDRGYWSQAWLSELNEKKVFFVTRERKNNRFKVKESRPTDRTLGYLCDQIVYQKSPGRGYYPVYRGKLRRISYRDPDTKKKLIFLTNRFDLATSTICALYKARWKVELFFKALKQNLKVKKFLGNSANAVKAQILVALIAFVLIQLVRWLTKARVSLPDAMAAIGTLLLLREPLLRLLGSLPRVTRHPPSFQLVLNI
jgi:putative transposase